MTREVRQLRVFDDARGSLLPVELADVGFPVARVFVVSGALGGSRRGGHEVPCHELVVLVAGRAEVQVRAEPDAPPESVILDRPGAAMELCPGETMSYCLADERSSVLVLADAPYDADRNGTR